MIGQGLGNVELELDNVIELELGILNVLWSYSGSELELLNE